jgi:Lytic transglycolase
VRGVFAQRALALAGAAILAGVVALVVSDRTGSKAAAPKLPQPVAAPGGGWYPARAGVEEAGSLPRRSACGYQLTAKTLGIAHPVLPCGAALYVAYGGVRALTRVVDRGPSGPGREFDLTPALAKKLGLHGIRQVEWAFAR